MNRTIVPFLLTSTFLASSGILGCATVPPPKDLVDARTAYAQAQQGPAAKESPADLEDARKALATAEAAYSDNPSDQETADLAYVAQRKILLASARGRAVMLEKQKVAADEQFKSTATAKLDETKAALGAEVSRSGMTAAALASEQKARALAEKKTREALDRLAALAAVKDDARGTVITLSGSVLFATDKWDLLPGANERLNQVADALKEETDRSITVYGFTDSQGTDAHNMQLSQKRAESVRNYLVSRGIDASRVKSEGRGKADPVADNKSPEGRANNRRVEIVLGKAREN
jgi:outer membrane protein OmpA-like peptidoglycan-associated protein